MGKNPEPGHLNGGSVVVPPGLVVARVVVTAVVELESGPPVVIKSAMLNIIRQVINKIF